MMKKIFFVLALAALSVLGAAAAKYAHKLLVNKADGSSVEYMFQNVPVATVDGDNLKITEEATGTSVLHPFADVVNLTFDKDELSAVETLGAEKPVAFAVSRDLLVAQGLPEALRVAVYDAAGALVASAAADASGAVAIPVANLAPGVYLVSAGSNSFKFVR